MVVVVVVVVVVDVVLGVVTVVQTVSLHTTVVSDTVVVVVEGRGEVVTRGLRYSPQEASHP